MLLCRRRCRRHCRQRSALPASICCLPLSCSASHLSCSALLCTTVAKQAKALGAKLRIQQGEEEEGGEEGGEEGAKRERLWGASKRSYYGADLADLEVSGWVGG